MYFITCFEQLPNSRINVDNKRTFGYFENFDEAEQALSCNIGDMHETIYYFAIVEKIDAGIHSRCTKRWFYQYDSTQCGFFQIKEPTEAKFYSNFAIG